LIGRSFLGRIGFESDNFCTNGPRSKFDRWSDGGSELNRDQCLNCFGATQITAELGSKSNLTRV